MLALFYIYKHLLAPQAGDSNLISTLNFFHIQMFNCLSFIVLGWLRQNFSIRPSRLPLPTGRE
jgi:hypothetical protein